MRLRTTATGLALTGLTLFGGVNIASSAVPAEVSESESGTTFVTDCGTFDVLDTFQLSASGRLFFDRGGNPIRIVEHVWGSDRLSNSNTGTSLTGTINSGEIVDLVEGKATQNGAVFRIVAPGAGALFVDVGRFVFDFSDGLVFLKGQHQFFDSDFEALCTALS
jgi:hypothetical protein